MTARSGTARSRASGHDARPVLITGGAGFIGTNLAHRLLADGERVILFDNLSRAGVERNVAFLRSHHDDDVELVVADVRDGTAVRAAVQRAQSVFHFAAQVAVTTSLVDPVEDFLVNARGTLNVLEALRSLRSPPPLVFTSTNKVYGGLKDVALERQPTRVAPADSVAASGFDETRPLDFHSPYGCSKGTADQYVIDYARSYGLPTVVFRMSCIYGPHQCGTEDQGWVAHFLLRSLAGDPLTIYGDGRQVRDILYVEDLVEAFRLARGNIARLAGNAFNIGGGAANSASLLEVIAAVAELNGRAPRLSYETARCGDQLYYISNHGKFTAATGWRPRVSARDGIARLYRWFVQSPVPELAGGRVEEAREAAPLAT